MCSYFYPTWVLQLKLVVEIKIEGISLKENRQSRFTYESIRLLNLYLISGKYLSEQTCDHFFNKRGDIYFAIFFSSLRNLMQVCSSWD